ncbi:hypothetical protein COU58_01045 [Candidatus Pacearchaeota archaeon CG10_big_fil_rev_8_21_14_0_10_32_42]|nr:MAG: hypothetical protein COU58_01045 [Candidatus Pacearchaeota archaeon CG10_big_fil_rev_8_21_14_0_10_32_42]
MKKDLLVFVKHILESIDKIEANIRDVSKVEFSKDENLHDATIRRLEVIGEAAKNLPSSFRKEHSSIEWKKIAGFRDKLIHHYFGVDLELVWKVIKDDLPKLKEDLVKIIGGHD